MKKLNNIYFIKYLYVYIFTFTFNVKKIIYFICILHVTIILLYVTIQEMIN